MLVRGWEVLDIYDARMVSPHKMTPFAQVKGMRIIYPAAASPAPPLELF